MTRTYSWISILGFVLILVASVFVFSRPSFMSLFGADKPAAIADIISGLTAPVIGAAGSILVYLSFNAQVEANKIQFKILVEQRDLDLLYKFYEELKEDLQGMQTVYGSKYGQSAILDSFMEYAASDKHNASPYPEFHSYLNFIFNQFNFLSNRIKRNSSLNSSEKVYIIDKLNYLFELYFKHHHIKLTKTVYSSDLSKQVRNSLEKVVFEMQKLEQIHKVLKDNLRVESGREPVNKS